MALFIKVLESRLLYEVVGFLLISMVHVTFQVNYVFQSSESSLLQELTHTVLITSLTIYVGFLEEIAYMLLQCVDAFLYTQHTDFLVDIQHFLKEVQIVTLDFNCIACFYQHTIIN